MEKQLALGLGSGDIAAIAEGLFIGTVGNAVTFVEDSAKNISHLILEGARSLFNSDPNHLAVADESQGLSGYAGGDSDFSAVDDFLNSFSGSTGGGGGDLDSLFDDDNYYTEPVFSNRIQTVGQGHDHVVSQHEAMFGFAR